MTDLIITKENQGVFTIILNRQDKKNAINNMMYKLLCKHFNYAKNKSAIHCVLIHGDKSCFCAGNDLQDFIECTQNDSLAALDFIKTLNAFHKPIIAAVAGPAVGIGTTLLLHCDMVFAANNTKFKLPFAQLGLCQEAGSSLLLSRMAGQNRAFELLVLGNTFDAEQAKEYGIVNQVCQPDDLLTTANATAMSIASLPNDAVITSRKLIRQATQQSLSQVIDSEAAEFSRLVKTDACKEIMARFFSK